MILARDIINEWGGILLPKGTLLNHVNFSRLFSNGVRVAYIREASIDADHPSLLELYEENKSIVVPTVTQASFIDFEKAHKERTQEIRKNLIAISNGEPINLEDLFKLTDGVMSKLKCKSDIFAYLGFLKATDEHTFSHSNNVSLLCNLFGVWMGLDQKDLMHLTTAGILHDLGKTKLDLSILNNTGKLTASEFALIKQHTVLGYRMMESQDIAPEVKLSALMHHEKIDGSGYPLGIGGARINDLAKIVSICDIYDAMTTNRIYREKLCPFDVIKKFEQQSFGVLDTKYLLTFLKNIAYTHVGSWVELNNGLVAEVVFVNQASLSRPIVKTRYGEIIDLSANRALNIVRVI
jgi:putative nucleotidyltransferase with HDIG domain